jgi:uncharacterized damage-inducible protein DinB
LLVVPRADDPEVGRWLWALDDARALTKEVLENIDQDVLYWALAPGGNTIGTLLYHLAAIEADWLYAEVLEQPVPADLITEEVRDGRGNLTAIVGKTVGEHLSLLEAVRARLEDVFKPMPAEEFRRVRRLPEYDVTPEWVLHHLSQHEAEHRGEILLLRERAEAALRP